MNLDLKHFAPAAVLATLLAGLSGAAPAAPDEYADARLQFRAALDAVERRQPLPEPSAQLRQYPLYPYLQALQLRQSIDSSLTPAPDNDAAISQFLKANGDQPMTRGLRRDWWQNLAQREEWPRFLAEVPADVVDPGLQCSRLTGLIKTGSGPELREDVLKLWLSGESRPQACVFVFDWLKQQGEMTDERKQRRVRLALDAGNLDLADFMITTLPPEAGASLQREAKLLRDPERELPKLVGKPDPAILQDSLLAAWTKLIRGQPQNVEGLLYPLLQAQQIGAARGGEFIRQLALGFAWNRDPQSLKYFLAVPDAALNDVGHEWRVRAALWNGDWAHALEWIRRMPESLASQPRWRYWLARALEANGEADAAKPVYLSLLDANNYYAVLSAAHLRTPVLPRPQSGPPPDEALTARLASHPGLVRAREWFLIERPDLARSEWNFALDGADRNILMQAARLASSWGWQVQAIGTAARAAVFDDYALLYPRPYEQQVRAGAQLASLPAPWVFGVLRQESLYDPRAVSKRDACGLMQLLLSTARTTAQRWQMPPPSREDLFVPDVNVQIGSAELRDMTDKFGGRFLLALGAYNAGATAVTRWLPPQPMDADIWVENIPFNETRAYIQKILWHIAVFGWRETGQPQDLSVLLQPVGGPAPVTAPATVVPMAPIAPVTPVPAIPAPVPRP